MNGSALLASLVLAYAGMLGFCLGKERHWKQLVSPRMPAQLRRLCIPAGSLLLGLAVYVAGQVWPSGMAIVAWFGLISLTGFALLMLIPYAPRLATALPALGGMVWIILALV
ncbi:DUF3325 domain-containing protein [Stutzerimonas xanthomarina]|uniref:DUF3325 domain-containing protein n=2 Tax=Stutzerimonas xanthomarina TaxID=271420 RepID=A0A1M5S794_9GAMM|nr:DUF3325 domain-containing protein [Stutzerimonas xanthomarina]MCP9340670.1 DUF3325 domain-containing protein [Stutzerimonas xanthomarina]SEH98710.1 Protein of unknown function [Stutzerimonas xanthomarina]SHH34374.1 Protein of unknown function [Stutzerimonas xanthomarina DSM 18231]